MQFELIPISKIDSYEVKQEIVYDLSVDEDFSYCVENNIAVHNSFCETKNKAGVSYKQFSVAVECGQAASELGALCCSDGGCSTPADICKALGGGSHLVMAGGLFSGVDECESEWQLDEIGNKKKMLMYGMSSKLANNKFFGGLKEYRTSEGKEGWVDYKGSVKDIIKDIKGSVASCCTYTNTKDLQNLSDNCIFTI